jgi:hypothetical protein
MLIQEMVNRSSTPPVTFATFHGLAETSHAFDALAVMKPWQPTMVGTDQPERFDGQRVSADYFRAIGVTPRWDEASSRSTTGSVAPMWLC